MQSISEIREVLANCEIEALSERIKEYEADSRKGVQALLASFRKKQDAHKREQKRLETMLFYERECYAAGIGPVAGVDEVGRGPLAGPVVAAAVILPKDCKIIGVNDSKKLSAKKREALYDVILEKAVAYGIGVVSPERIDEINILQATREAMRQALEQLKPAAAFVLVDGTAIPALSIPQKGIVKGDGKSLSIAAASIVAKVTRDRMMEGYEQTYPGYGFGVNKGYGTAEHIAAIREKGICPIHRRSFVHNFVPWQEENPTQKGNRGEALAVKQMKKLGYEILERNYRGQAGEIDIIAKKDTYIVFTEVKYRKDTEKGTPAEAVDFRKQQHIIGTAEAYIAEQALGEDVDFRFDVAEVLTHGGKTYFRYTEDAFRLPQKGE